MRAFAARSPGAPWPTPTSAATGASTPTSPRCSFVAPERCTLKDDFGVALKQAAYALDSTTIDLCLALFPWARFRRRKGAVKLHTLIDLRGNIPCFIRISHGKTARCERPRSPADRAGRLLHDGPRLHRLRALVCLHATAGVLRHPRQAEHRLQPPGVPRGRQVDRPAQRSDDRPSRTQDVRISIRLRCAALRSTTRNTNGDWCS